MTNEVQPDPVLPSSSDEAGKICPQCGWEYGSDALFCLKDGSKLNVRTPTTDLVGRVIAERYRILRKVGEGGMGKVYLAEHITMGRMCAIKVMHPTLRSDPEAVGRFRREAANSARINHPNVAAIYDCGESADQTIYLAMEYIPGDALSAVLKWEGPLPPRRAVEITRQIASALGAAHELGIVHRDLKPDNIMLTRGRDGMDLVKVVDFGIAKATQGSSQTVTRTGFVIGTFEYMSPEQIAGEAVDGRSDIYSLGCILFQILVGHRIYEGVTAEVALAKRLTESPPRPGKVNPQVPRALDAVVEKMLARSREQRFQSVAELMVALDTLSLEPPLSLGRRLITPWRGFRATAEEPVVPSMPASEEPSIEPSAIAPPEPETPPTFLPGVSRFYGKGLAAVAVLGLAALIAFQLGSRESTPVLPPPATPPSATPAFQAEGPVDPGPAQVGGAELPTGSGTTVGDEGADRHPVPVLREISPSERSTATRSSFSLSVRGRGFSPSSVVRWNGSDRPTTFVSSSELRANITARDIARAHRAQVTVASPVPGGGVSMPLSFVVRDPPAQTASGPARETLQQLRRVIDEARIAASAGEFSTAIRALRGNGDQITSLQANFPTEQSLRDLAARNSEALESITKACVALAVIAVENEETTVPVCK